MRDTLYIIGQCRALLLHGHVPYVLKTLLCPFPHFDYCDLVNNFEEPGLKPNKSALMLLIQKTTKPFRKYLDKFKMRCDKQLIRGYGL